MVVQIPYGKGNFLRMRSLSTSVPTGRPLTLGFCRRFPAAMRPISKFAVFITMYTNDRSSNCLIDGAERSLVELLQGGASGLSVLRTFRLLRILKVVRFLPALRYQLVVMLRTMDNVATFFALLVLFIFIFRSQLSLQTLHLHLTIQSVECKVDELTFFS